MWLAKYSGFVIAQVTRKRFSRQWLLELPIHFLLMQCNFFTANQGQDAQLHDSAGSLDEISHLHGASSRDKENASPPTPIPAHLKRVMINISVPDARRNPTCQLRMLFCKQDCSVHFRHAGTFAQRRRSLTARPQFCFLSSELHCGSIRCWVHTADFGYLDGLKTE